MLISQECFNDTCLISIIRRNNRIGNCNFSNKENVYIIDFEQLVIYCKKTISDIFELYKHEDEHLYMPNPKFYKDGDDMTKHRTNAKVPYDKLINLLQKDWNLFNLENLSVKNANQILVLWVNMIKPILKYDITVIEDSNWYDMRYKYWGFFVKEDWEFINKNMRYNFRYNINNIPNINFNIENILSDELFYEISYLKYKGSILFRGRIKGMKDTKFKRKDMLIPPKTIKTVGRANPIGINYLYSASDIETVLAEVRPWIDCTVSVATLELKEDAKIIDLTMACKNESIFQSDMYNQFDLIHRLEYNDIESLLYETLKRPVDPRESDLEYIFTQYICEVIRTKGYDGIIFESSLAEGHNCILFSDDKVRIKSIQDYTVKKIKYYY